ncbi:hypothetical protein CIPAW_15G169900 [Carya illinoinensis]|uniref:Uncharacterized protein n=1 Tax=Carya illinoinensis TaxID=32201 RepID=A0A8T1N8G8_CARIL|nr:hypothetical protein CIPAW_15G169900 [Carya illinoinensis]
MNYMKINLRDLAHSWRDNSEDHDPEVGSRHFGGRSSRSSSVALRPTRMYVFPYRESLVHNPNKSLLVDLEDRDSCDLDLLALLRSSPAD